MGHQKISAIRRQELVQATMMAIYEHGFADLTVAQIANYAQVSTGSIHYYFGGKDGLLEGTMRHLLALLGSAHYRRLQMSSDPASRLHAVVQANFDDTLMTREACRVWTQFWAFAPYHAKLARLHRINRARVKSNIHSPLSQLVAPEELQVTTNAIQGYMDGVWIQVAQSDTAIDLDELQSEASRFVSHIISSAN